DQQKEFKMNRYFLLVAIAIALTLACVECGRPSQVGNAIKKEGQNCGKVRKDGNIYYQGTCADGLDCECPEEKGKCTCEGSATTTPGVSTTTPGVGSTTSGVGSTTPGVGSTTPGVPQTPSTGRPSQVGNAIKKEGQNCGKVRKDGNIYYQGTCADGLDCECPEEKGKCTCEGSATTTTPGVGSTTPGVGSTTPGTGRPSQVGNAIKKEGQNCGKIRKDGNTFFQGTCGENLECECSTDTRKCKCVQDSFS
ncbi:unnamed protein product, partial [Owenia fusiformis]